MDPNQPAAFTPKTNKWKITAIILIVISVLLTGLSTFLLIEKLNQKDDPEITEENSNDEDQSSSNDSGSELPTYAYLVVAEWGVKFQIPDGLYNVNYYTLQSASAGSGMIFSANGFTSDPYYTNSVNYCDMGSLIQFTDEAVSNTPSDTDVMFYTEEERDNAIKIGDYYYSYNTYGSPQACDNSTNTALVKQMLSNIEPIE